MIKKLITEKVSKNLDVSSETNVERNSADIMFPVVRSRGRKALICSSKSPMLHGKHNFKVKHLVIYWL